MKGSLIPVVEMRWESEIEPERGNASDFVARLRENDIWCFAIGPQAVRLVTHLDVSSAQIERTCQVIQSIAAGIGTQAGFAHFQLKITANGR